MAVSKSEFIELVTGGDFTAVRSALEETPELASTRDAGGRSVLMLAAYTQNVGMVELLREHLAGIDLYEAATLGELDRLHQALQETPVNQAAPDGFSALGLACFFGRESAARQLLKAGADVNQAAANDFKVTPLHSAAARSNLGLVKLLLKHGADVNAAQANGVTALHSAAHNGQLELVRSLVDAGARINARMEDGRTPLSFAEKDGYPEIAQFLKEKGAVL